MKEYKNIKTNNFYLQQKKAICLNLETEAIKFYHSRLLGKRESYLYSRRY